MDGLSSSNRSTGIDALFQYTGSGAQIFSGSIFYIIITHLFSTSGVGAIALFVAIVGLFSVFFQFGLSAASQHFTSYKIGEGDYAAARLTIYKILGYALTLSLVAFASLIITAPEISLIFLHSSSFTFLVSLLGMVLFGNIMFSILNGILLGMQNFRISALINVVIWMSYYFGAIILAIYFRSIHTIIFGWALGILIGVAVELLIVLISINRFMGPGKAIPSTFIFAYSIPILLSGIISYGASSSDRLIVSGMLNLSSLGVYNFSLLIAGSLAFVAVPFNNILMPKFSEFYGRGKMDSISNIVRVSSTLLSLIYVPAALGIAALSPMVLNLLGGVNYVGGSLALDIIMFITALVISQNIFAQALAAVRMTKIFLYSSVVSLFSNVALSFILIPKFGLAGAAIGFSSVYVSVFLTLYYFGKKNQLIAIDYHSLAKIWIASGIMYLAVNAAKIVFGQSELLILFYIILGVLVYTFVARFLKIFAEDDKFLLLSIFPEGSSGLRKILSLFILH